MQSKQVVVSMSNSPEPEDMEFTPFYWVEEEELQNL